MNVKVRKVNRRNAKLLLIAGTVNLVTPLLFLGVIFLIIGAAMWRKYK
ncbi:MAG TPA: hypothetical protein VJA47_05705 [archaeon]|nr:hypothetical protein [archaeon]